MKHHQISRRDFLKTFAAIGITATAPHFLAAGSYQRTPDRKGYANGFKPKTVDTRMGRITVDVPRSFPD